MPVHLQLEPLLLTRSLTADHMMVASDTLAFLKSLPLEPLFDLVVTSPPYNIGKPYEFRRTIDAYFEWQQLIIAEIVPRMTLTGSLCWQVGNYVANGRIDPLDLRFAPIFSEHKLILRNRIIWHFGHGLNTQRRFSGRYEVILWYTRSDQYTFNLDPVRVPSKYPNKRHYRGPKRGQLSGNPLGKNPSDVWEIPNVKAQHVEKTAHPCQFPVGLVERLILSMTDESDLVFDPFAGVGSAGVAAALHGRRFWGVDVNPAYVVKAAERIDAALDGTARYRPHDRPIYDHTTSPLAVRPEEWLHRQTEE